MGNEGSLLIGFSQHLPESKVQDVRAGVVVHDGAASRLSIYHQQGYYFNLFPALQANKTLSHSPDSFLMNLKKIQDNYLDLFPV